VDILIVKKAIDRPLLNTEGTVFRYFGWLLITGKVKCRITTAERCVEHNGIKKHYIGVAICFKDNFCKKIGRSIAKARLERDILAEHPSHFVFAHTISNNSDLGKSIKQVIVARLEEVRAKYSGRIDTSLFHGAGSFHPGNILYWDNVLKILNHRDKMVIGWRGDNNKNA
jgi:hypothetical protein